jgi:hypothetical protein
LRFFALSVTTSLKIPGAVIPRRVFTQPGPDPDAERKKHGAVQQDVSSRNARLWNVVSPRRLHHEFVHVPGSNLLTMRWRE